MQKICLQCGTNFEITDANLEFYKKVSPKISGKVYEIAPPCLCHICRDQRRMSLRNERNLYRRTCDMCQKDIVSLYHKDVPYPVYCQDCWYSDKNDSTKFGKDFDFNKTFSEQFQELQNTVPRAALVVYNNENCSYVNFVGDSKNCYLIFGSIRCEDCYYGSPYYSKNCVDSLRLSHCELCYECVDSEKLYNCVYCQNCDNSHDLKLCYNCVSCESCFGCSGLRHKKYHIYNQKVSPEEYKKFVENADLNDGEIIRKFEEIKKNSPKRFMVGTSNENVNGDYIWNSKNIDTGFMIVDCEDGKYITQTMDSRDIMDITYGEEGESLYEICGYYQQNFSAFTDHCWTGASNLLYSSICFSTTDSFGSIGLKKEKYCILNKKYSKEEYEKLIPKIIDHMEKSGEWGEFRPANISPYGYNETTAQEYFPLSREEVLKRGWKWRDEEEKIPNVTKIIPSDKLPDNIQEVPDDILAWAIKCAKTGKPFRIQKAELEFYRKMNLPIPHLHPDVRHENRMKKRNIRKLWERKCAICEIAIKTTFAPEPEEKVLCEECYLKEID